MAWGLMQTAAGPVATEAAPEARAGQGERPDDAVIALRLGGICATDLELAKGYMGFEGVLGHEWVGQVIDAPDRAWIGRRVVGDINCPCGRCAVCAAGRPTHCPSRTVLGIAGRDGAFRQRFSLPLANLHAVPDGVADEAAVFVEPLAAALQILHQVHVRPQDRLVVLGVGRLGQLCARVLALTGAQVTAVGRRASSVARLPARSGILGVVGAEHLPEGVADVVVDTTGSPDGLSIATRLVRARGTVVLKTTVHEAAPQLPTPWVVDEITLVGSRCGPSAPALRLLASGAVDPTDLITASYPLSDGVAALKAAATRDHVKVVLRGDGGAL